MAAPVYSSAGAGADTATSGAALSPACPSTVNVDDLLLAHICHRTTTTTPSTPAGWSLLSGPHSAGSTATGRHWLYGKIADGTEDSTTVSFGTTGGTSVRHGRIYRFTGNRHDSTLYAVAGYAHEANTSTSITDVGITTPEVDCVAVNLIYVCDDNAVASFTGETGGDWTEAVAEFTTMLGADGCMQIQTATMASAGTVNGGTQTMAASDPWGNLGFYIRAPAVGDQSATDGGAIPSGEAFGTTGGIGMLQSITDGGGIVSAEAFDTGDLYDFTSTPPGGKIALFIDQGGINLRPNLDWVDPNTDTFTVLIPSPSPSTGTFGGITWSLDATKLAYLWQTFTPPSGADSSIRFITDTSNPGYPWDEVWSETDNPTKVLDFNFPGLSFSPDGTQLTFAYSDNTANRKKVAKINIDGTGFTDIYTGAASNEAVQNAVWSPDGTKIAFSRGTFNTTNKISYIAPDGTGLTDVTDFTTWSFPLDWFNTSDKLLIGRLDPDFDDTFGVRIATLDDDGSNFTEVLHDADGTFWGYDGSLNADDTKVALTGDTQVWTINVNGTGLDQIGTLSVDAVADVSWSPSADTGDIDLVDGGDIGSEEDFGVGDFNTKLTDGGNIASGETFGVGALSYLQLLTNGGALATPNAYGVGIVFRAVVSNVGPFEQTLDYNHPAAGFPLPVAGAGTVIPGNPSPDDGNLVDLVVPFTITNYIPPTRKPTITTITSTPIIDATSNLSYGGQTLGQGALAFATITLEGFIDTPLIVDSNFRVPELMINNIRHHYAEFIVMCIEGRLSSPWVRRDPRWYRDPYGRVFNDPVILDFTATFVEGVPFRTNFTMQLAIPGLVV